MSDFLSSDKALRIIAILLERLGGDAQFIADEDMMDIGNPAVEVVPEPMRDGFRIRAWNKNDRFPPGPARGAPIQATATIVQPLALDAEVVDE